MHPLTAYLMAQCPINPVLERLNRSLIEDAYLEMPGPRRGPETPPPYSGVIFLADTDGPYGVVRRSFFNFTTNEIRDVNEEKKVSGLSDIAKKLEEHVDPVSFFLWSTMSESNRIAITNY